MKRRAATALFVFFVAMACFGILSRAVSSTGTVLVAAEAPSTQTFAQEAIEADGGTAFDPGAAAGGEAAPGCATVPEGEAPEASVDELSLIHISASRRAMPNTRRFPCGTCRSSIR